MVNLETNVDKIEKSIAEISSVADNLPGVVILHDLRDWSIAWMSNRGLMELNISLDEIRRLSAEQYYGTYFNNDDAKDYVPKILSFIAENKEGDFCTCFQQVRFSVDSEWRWHFSSTKIFLKDDEGKPLIGITMAFPIDTMHHMVAKAARLLEENNFLRKNHSRFATLSEREQEVLRLMALGKSSAETAEQLSISQFTVDTHRRNIKIKLKTSSFYDLTQYARAFDLI